jgi:FAD/FMN-containing dehydrogenase
VTFEVVLANGTITTASSTTNPTLFRALKGGSNNFGIVTRFDAKLFSQSPYWGGFIFQPIENKEAVFEFISNFTVSATYDPYSALITSFAWVAGIPTIEQNAVYTNGDVAWPPPAFKALQDMPKVTQATRKDTTSSFATELEAAAALTNGHNNIFVTATVVNKPGVTQDFLAEVYELSNAAAQELISVVGLIFTCAIQPLPNSIYSKSAATGGNVLGLDRFKNDLINVLYTVSWTLPTDNARMEVAMKDLEADIEAKAKEMGIYNEWIYLNYAAGWQDPIIGYGATNVAFMKGVSKKYDPNGIFQKAVPGGFKLHL